QKIRQGGQQQRAEFPFLTAHFFHGLPFQETGEKGLSQIFGRMRVRAAPSYECVNRIPIFAAELFQSSRRPGEVTLTRRQHHAPVSSGKSARLVVPEAGVFRRERMVPCPLHWFA